MDFYFGSVYKSKNFGLCSFSIPEYGLLQRSVVLDKDKISLEFSSLLLMFEFILLNPLFFRDIKVFSIYGSDPKVFCYIKSDRNIPKKVEPFKSAFNAFSENIIDKLGVYFDFFLISNKKNAKFLNIDSMRTNKNLALRLTALSKEYINDRNKNL